MIQKNFVIDPKNKKIRLDPKSKDKTYTVQKLYSYLMDTFDNPEYMRYDIPIKAVSKSKFKLINGWTIDNKILKLLKGGVLKTGD